MKSTQKSAPKTQRCPKCHKEFTGYPAISREDNKTEICPECGMREAIDDWHRWRNTKPSK